MGRLLRPLLGLLALSLGFAIVGCSANEEESTSKTSQPVSDSAEVQKGGSKAMFAPGGMTPNSDAPKPVEAGSKLNGQ